MESRKIIIEGINPADLFGINNINLKHLKTFFPKLSILSRGNVVIIEGEQEFMDAFEGKFELILQHFNTYNVLEKVGLVRFGKFKGKKLNIINYLQ